MSLDTVPEGCSDTWEVPTSHTLFSPQHKKGGGYIHWPLSVHLVRLTLKGQMKAGTDPGGGGGGGGGAPCSRPPIFFPSKLFNYSKKNGRRPLYTAVVAPPPPAKNPGSAPGRSHVLMGCLSYTIQDRHTVTRKHQGRIPRIFGGGGGDPPNKPTSQTSALLI